MHAPHTHSFPRFWYWIRWFMLRPFNINLHFTGPLYLTYTGVTVGMCLTHLHAWERVFVESP